MSGIQDFFNSVDKTVNNLADRVENTQLGSVSVETNVNSASIIKIVAAIVIGILLIIKLK